MNVHVYTHTHSLQDLEEFIKAASGGLNKGVEEGDYNGLVSVMGNLMAVKDKQQVLCSVCIVRQLLVFDPYV